MTSTIPRFLDAPVRLSLERLDELVPEPIMGYRVDWSRRNQRLGRLLGDQRTCPGIGWRESIGLTLVMPYSIRFFRDGRVSVTHRRGLADSRVVSFLPRQSTDRIVGRSRDGDPTMPPRPHAFPLCRLDVPGPVDARMPLQLFHLGDIRLGNWVLDSGVISTSPLPPGYVALEVPLPNEQVPRGYRVGQAISNQFHAEFHLKIPLELWFSDLEPAEDSVFIERGTPMIQYIVCRLPQVEAKVELSTMARSARPTEDTHVVLAEAWERALVTEQRRSLEHGVELQICHAHGDALCELAHDELAILDQIRRGTARVRDLAAMFPLLDVLQVLRGLHELGAWAEAPVRAP